MGDRIVVMRDGRIQQVDVPLNLYRRPVNQFVAGFIGSPAMNFVRGTLKSTPDGLVFDEGQVRLPLSREWSEHLDAHGGREVILGIRPEDIHDSADRSAGHGGTSITARVEVVEPMGSEVLLYLTTGNTSFVARVDPQCMPEVEGDVQLYVDMSNAHFFDCETEESLLASGSP